MYTDCKSWEQQFKKALFNTPFLTEYTKIDAVFSQFRYSYSSYKSTLIL